ncbi:MAG: DNA-binding protein [Zoogloeaceae bacterium]|jgi:gp16 family phage-associated protein|nr:DNA-binding protein [Zoogloeaceae bacterium]
MKTPDQVRHEFKQRGITITEWSRRNGYDRNKVYRVLCGIEKGNFGKCYEIAWKLGLKPAPNDIARADA